MVFPCAIQAMYVFETASRYRESRGFMCNTAKRSASVVVLSFSYQRAYVACASGEDHKSSTDNRTNRMKIKKRFTDANVTQKASAFG